MLNLLYRLILLNFNRVRLREEEASIIGVDYYNRDRLNMEVDLQSIFGSMSRDVKSCSYSLRPRNSLPPPAFGLVLRGRYWSAKIDDIS
jgi:hypothetical protein